MSSQFFPFCFDFGLDDFGFKDRIWIFSGRRGIHCWVSDTRARNLSSLARKAIVSFLELKRGGSETKRKVFLPSSLHPSLEYINGFTLPTD